MREEIEKILKKYIYASYNSETDNEPKAVWPDEMVDRIIDIFNISD